MADPAIQDDDALATRLGQIADHFTEAIARGERPSVEAYAHDHPELAPLLRQVLPTIEAVRSSTAGPAAFMLPAVLGDFRLVREIGRGGMGVVYEAEQISFARKVALKLLPPHPGLDAKFLTRFEREARTAASLHHTSIVPVYAVGCEQGVHYYAMQFIDGQGLDQLLQNWRAGSVSDRSNVEGSPRAVARIGLQVAEALDYAHQRGIVHRDIKPSNLLLDAAGIVWITDFGLVKNLDESDNLTRTGDIVGTARYMSPEQTSTKRGPVDGRTDVYSLGVTLYEMLTLRPAFDGDDHAAVLQQVALVEPVAPRQHNRGVPRDLETIVLKAMAKNPEDRYRSAGALAAELRRFLAGEAILARPLGSLERCRRWCKRNPLIAGLTAAVAVTLLIGTAVSTFFAIQADDRAREALHERDRADGKAEEARANAERVREEKRISDRHLYVAHMNLVQQAWERGHAGRVQQLLEALTPAAGHDDLRGFDWQYFWRQSQRDRLRWQAHEHAISSVAWSPAGRLLATGSHDGSVRVWDPDNGKLMWKLAGHAARVRAVAFAPEGLTLVSASQDRSVKLWDLSTGDEWKSLETGAAALSLAIATDGRIAVGTLAGSIRLFDAAGAALGQAKQPGGVFALAFAPDGTALASGGDDRVVRVWDPMTLKEPTRLEGHGGTIRALAFSPDSLTLASAGYDMAIRLWDITTSMPGATLRGHNDTISGIAFSPDGGTLASAEGDPGHLFLPKQQLRSRPGGVRARPGEVKLWDVATGLERTSLRRHAGPVYCVAYRPDGAELASAGDDMAVVLWDTADQVRTQLPGHMREVNAVAISPNGWLLASGSDDRTVRLWDMTTGQQQHIFANLGNIKAVAFSPDGSRLAAGGGERSIRIWDTDSNQFLMTLKGHTRTVRGIAYSADGHWLISAAGDPYQKPAKPGEVFVWDARTGDKLAELPGHLDVVRGVAVSPDGRWIAAGGDDRTMRLWDAQTRQEAAALAMDDGVRSVAFAPDSQTLAIAGGDSFQDKPGEVVLWDVAQRKRRAVLEGHRATVLVVSFAPDGQTLATGSTDGTVRLWDAVTGQERALLEGHQGLVRALAFSTDGKALATGDNEALIRLWLAE